MERLGRIGGLLTCAVGMMFFISDAPAHTFADDPTETELRVELVEMGYTPAHLCAAGISVAEGRVVYQRAVAALSDRWATISQGKQSLMYRRVQAAILQRVVRSGTATAQQQSELISANQSVAAAQATLDLAESEVASFAQVELSTAQRTMLGRVAGNARLPIPVKYRVMAKTPAEWVSFSRALAQVRTNPDVDAQAAAVIAQADTHPDVSMASVLVSSYAAQMKMELETAIAQ